MRATKFPGELSRLPSGEPWGATAPADDPALPGTVRVAATTARLAALLRAPEPVPLRYLAGEVDAVGAAAISALAEASSWTLPRWE